MFASFESQVPDTCCATRSESPRHLMHLMFISFAMRSPCSNASYSAVCSRFWLIGKYSAMTCIRAVQGKGFQETALCIERRQCIAVLPGSALQGAALYIAQRQCISSCLGSLSRCTLALRDGGRNSSIQSCTGATQDKSWMNSEIC